eukprot:8429082-Ditylum_brightwellii.AAC.1
MKLASANSSVASYIAAAEMSLLLDNAKKSFEGKMSIDETKGGDKANRKQHCMLAYIEMETSERKKEEQMMEKDC